MSYTSQMSQNRIVVKFAGPSGKGINTLGKIVSKSIKNSGFYNFAYREYPSLIKGGVASYQIDIANHKIVSSSRDTDILALLTNQSKERYLEDIRENGVIIYGKDELTLTDEEKEWIEKKSLHLLSLDTAKLALDAGGTEIMANMVLLGFIWRLLSLKPKALEEVVRETFKNKDVDMEAEISCVMAGYNCELAEEKLLKPILFEPNEKLDKSLSITGNQAIALGAITAGCRAYYAYPMTPATSIFKFLGETYQETGILVKQAENEITAVQMAMGSMNMGTRAMTATSGGGFDLMSETLSCAGISEVPLVVVLAQRAGAGTGVPTWTGAGDVLLAVNAGHGEFPRCVISVSNPEDAYELTQKAFNIAEIYQLPVILLTDKQIAESIFNTDELPKPIKIERGLKVAENRYEITDDGISPRWIPSEENPVMLVSSDEHKANSQSTEDSTDVIEMSDKRMRKLETLKESLPEPKYIGNKDAEIVFVGCGSAGNAVEDILESYPNIGYLKYQYLYPLKYEKIIELHEDGARIVIVENNQNGEFAKLIKQESGFEIPERLLKYNGRPFFIEDILDFLNN